MAKKVSSARRHTNHKAEEKCFREANPEEKKKEKEKKNMTLHATVKGYESGTEHKIWGQKVFQIAELFGSFYVIIKTHVSIQSTSKGFF